MTQETEGPADEEDGDATQMEVEPVVELCQKKYRKKRCKTPLVDGHCSRHPNA